MDLLWSVSRRRRKEVLPFPFFLPPYLEPSNLSHSCLSEYFWYSRSWHNDGILQSRNFNNLSFWCMNEITFKFQHFGYVVWEYVREIFHRYNYPLFHVRHTSLFCMTLIWLGNVWILPMFYLSLSIHYKCIYLSVYMLFFVALHTFFESMASTKRTRTEKKPCSYECRQAYVQYILVYNTQLRRLSISFWKVFEYIRDIYSNLVYVEC